MSRYSFRTAAFAFVLGTGSILFATASEAAVPIAPLSGDSSIVNVAQGCGPGRWRGPGGWCHGPGWRHWHHWHHRQCWRGPYGGLHCRWW